MVVEFYPGSLTKAEVKGSSVLFTAENHSQLAVTALTDDIIRFRHNTDGLFEKDFSYAISGSFDAPTIQCKDLDSEYVITTVTVKVSVKKKDLKVRITDLEGNVILDDEKGFHWEENSKSGGNIVQMSKVVQEGEHFYGLGDKPVHLNLRGKRLVNWGMDEYGYHKGTDPLYKNIPFYQGLHNGRAYGVFFDNTFKAYFDFASERKIVTSFWADGGEMNYYFINGPQLMDVTKRYNKLTGSPELPPLWALGYHQCKWSYYPESQVRDICNTFREKKIPLDAFYLDIDYMDGFRCFTWDPEKFPAPKKMVEDLKDQGIKTIVIIDPGIKIDREYDVFLEGLKNDYYCKRADGPYVKGKVWPGDCYFPDFTKPEVREWWADLFKGLIEDVGVQGVWNDMNEPALFEIEGKTFPLDVRHDYDGNPCSHRKGHNVYGMQMSRATYEGVKKYSAPKRPFIITRSTYSGGQRFSSAWTGDNIATWEHLWLANVQAQRMSVSGWSFVGSDVGGFIEQPSPELYVRWVQLATFHSFFRTHSSGDHGEQEPWSFGEEALNVVRKFIELRYQLLPYLYTSFYQHVAHGTPMLRPLSMIEQDNPEALYRVDESMQGDSLLICPILEPNSNGRYIYLPKGEWYEYWEDERLIGGREQFFSYSLDTSPLFIKAGAVIPMYPVQQYVGEKSIETLDLHVYFGKGELTSELYEDKGDGYDYENGDRNIKKFKVKGTNATLTVDQTIDGTYQPEYRDYKMIFHGVDLEDVKISIDGKELSNFTIENKCIVFKAELNFGTITLKFS